MGTVASQITSLTVVYSTVYSDADQRKHQSSASLAFVWGIHRGPVNSPHKWPVTRKMFPFDDVIMIYLRHMSQAPISILKWPIKTIFNIDMLRGILCTTHGHWPGGCIHEPTTIPVGADGGRGYQMTLKNDIQTARGQVDTRDTWH